MTLPAAARRGAGYTLVELLVAVSLSAIVMSGIISVASSVIRYQVEGGTRGTWPVGPS